MARDFPTHHNILLGKGAGKYLTTESYRFHLKLEGFRELKTKLSRSEYRILKRIVDRMLEEKVCEHDWQPEYPKVTGTGSGQRMRCKKCLMTTIMRSK